MADSVSIGDDLPFGKWLRKRRLEKNKSQEVVGGLAGVCASTVASLELGYRGPSIVSRLCLLYRVADVLEIPREEVVARIAREADALVPREKRQEKTVWSAKS